MSTYTSSLGLELITPGSQAGLWGNTTNNTFTLVDQAITGVTPISFASASGSTYTLTDFNGAPNEARSAVLNITGTAIGANNVVVPNKQKTYLVRNNTGQDVVIKTASPTATYTVGAGYSILVFCDGNNNVFTGIASPSVGTLSVNAGGTGQTTFTAGFVKSPGGTGALTSSATVALGSEVSGTLPVTSGGTGQTSLTSGALLVGNGSGAMAVLTGGTNNYGAVWNGSTWTSQAIVNSITAGSGVTISGSTGNITISTSGAASGVASITAGTGISVNQATGAVTITNTGPSLSSNNAWTGTASWSNTCTHTANVAFQANGSYNFYNSLTGYLYNSIYYGATSTALADQGYVMAFKTPSVNNFSAVYSFYGDGTAYKPGGGTWTASSDARLKDNVQPLSGSLQKIASLRPVTFNWKTSGESEPTTGFIAQEVEQVMPTAVNRRAPTDAEKQYVDDKVLGIGWQNDMIAYLVGAIQELKAEVDALKAAK